MSTVQPVYPLEKARKPSHRDSRESSTVHGLISVASSANTWSKSGRVAATGASVIAQSAAHRRNSAATPARRPASAASVGGAPLHGDRR